MKTCPNCGFSKFEKENIVSYGAVRLRYQCPDCQGVSKTDIKSLFIMLTGLAFLFSGVILLYLEKTIPVYQNIKIISLFAITVIIFYIGVRLIKLEPDKE